MNATNDKNKVQNELTEIYPVEKTLTGILNQC